MEGWVKIGVQHASVLYLNSCYIEVQVYMKKQLNAFGICQYTCFMQIRQVAKLLKSATSNKTENDNNNYYYNTNKITIMRCRIEVFSAEFSSFWHISVIRCISVFLVMA